MASFTRFTRYVKDVWKVFIRGENDDLRRQTLSMEDELARLRNRRLASDKECEARALNEARNAVHKLRELRDNLLAAEQAAAEFASKLGDAAKSTLEAHKEMREEACKKFFIQQKQQMFANQMVPELPSETSALESHLNQQEKERGVAELKASRAAEDKDFMLAAMEADEPSFHSLQVNVEGNREDARQSLVSQGNKDEALAVDDVELMDDVPPEVLERMLEEARKQVRFEEKSHLDALSRNKAILEKEIEAQEMAERGRMPQGR